MDLFWAWQMDVSVDKLNSNVSEMDIFAHQQFQWQRGLIAIGSVNMIKEMKLE